MEIGKLSLHKIVSSKNTNNKANESQNAITKPFGVSFKGNVIQADVFEGAKKPSFQENMVNRSKLFASIVVSGINNFNEAFKSRMNSVISFGKKFSKDFCDRVEKIGNTEIKIDFDGIKNKLFPDRQYSVKNLSMKSTDDLKNLWIDLEPIEE